MNDQIRVLIADGGTKQALPFSKALKKLGCRVAVLCASRLETGYASRYPDEKLLEPAVQASPEARYAAVRKYAQTGRCDLVLTFSDQTAEQLSLHKQELEELGVKAAVEPRERFYQAYDKRKTMELCQTLSLPHPKTWPAFTDPGTIPFDSLTYPLIVKPAMSYGAIGLHTVKSEAELKKLLPLLGEDLSGCLFQEFIPQNGMQYECAMFLDNEGAVRTACVFSKPRWYPVSGGSSTFNETVLRPDIVENCTRLLQRIGWRGAADIDLIEDPRDGSVRIMEINPRCSGSVKVVFDAGVNIAEQMLCLYTGRPVPAYLTYTPGRRLRILQTDFLWFLKSPDRFRAKPSWFCSRHTKDATFSLDDPLPFFAFSIGGLARYKTEMKKRS